MQGLNEDQKKLGFGFNDDLEFIVEGEDEPENEEPITISERYRNWFNDTFYPD